MTLDNEGIYAKLLRPALERVGASNLVLRSEDLYANPLKILATVTEFVGVPPFAFDEDKAFKRTGKPFCNISDFFTPDDRLRLRQFYREENVGLEEMVGWNYN